MAMTVTEKVMTKLADMEAVSVTLQITGGWLMMSES
jgi:hypothetical protein